MHMHTRALTHRQPKICQRIKNIFKSQVVLIDILCWTTRTMVPLETTLASHWIYTSLPRKSFFFLSYGKDTLLTVPSLEYNLPTSVLLNIHTSFYTSSHVYICIDNTLVSLLDGFIYR